MFGVFGFLNKNQKNPARVEQESVKSRDSDDVGVASHGQVQDFFVEVCLCVHKVKQIQEAALLFITIPCQGREKGLKLISETQRLP